MKKIILTCFIVFFICGCTVDYNLEIIDDEYREFISINNVSSVEIESEVNDYNIPIYINYDLKNPVGIEKEEGINYYDKVNNTYSHTFGYQDYFRSYFANSAYSVFVVLYDQIEEDTEEPFVIISTGTELELFDKLDSITEINVSIKTNHVVKSSNADIVDGNLHKWNLKKDDDIKTIQLSYYKDKKVSNYNGENTKKILFVGAIILLISTIIIVSYKIKKRFN